MNKYSTCPGHGEWHSPPLHIKGLSLQVELLIHLLLVLEEAVDVPLHTTALCLVLLLLNSIHLKFATCRIILAVASQCSTKILGWPNIAPLYMNNHKSPLWVVLIIFSLFLLDIKCVQFIKVWFRTSWTFRIVHIRGALVGREYPFNRKFHYSKLKQIQYNQCELCPE